MVFNEITKKAIRKAFEDPGCLNTNRVDAQQARRFLDRVVGFMVSPLLWEKVGRGLSAGRVQSVALKMIVEREREIRAFEPEEYWTVQADLEQSEAVTSLEEPASVVRFDVKKYLCSITLARIKPCLLPSPWKPEQRPKENGAQPLDFGCTRRATQLHHVEV